MTPTDQFFVELKRAIARGFTLAAVSGALACGTPTVTPDSGGSPGVHNADGSALAQAPDDSFACTGDAGDMGPYYGACCTKLHCYTTTEATCDSAAMPFGQRAFNPSLPPGSGTCTCGETKGPFAAPDSGTDQCCYVVGSIGCTGRPLREGEAALVAAVVLRADWS